MPEIKFSNEKAERWLDRIGKRLGTLSPEESLQYQMLRDALANGRKLDSQEAKALWVLGKKL
jgi:hypothetical protein